MTDSVPGLAGRPGLNVAIITLGVYPVRRGGVEMHSYYHARGLRERGDDVRLFTKRYATTYGDELRVGVPVTSAGSALPVVGPVLFVAQVLLSLLRARREVDIVHVHYATYFVLPAYLFHLLTSKPFVVSCHGFDILQLRGSLAWRLLQRAMLRAASVVTAASSEVRSALSSVYRVEARRLAYVPNGVDDREVEAARTAAEAPDGLTVAMVANLRPAKDPLTGLRAFGRALKEFPGMRLVVVGDGSLRGRVEEYLRENGLEGSVRLVGSVAHGEALRLVAGAGVFMMPSVSEGGNPLALMEAMRLGKVVVASDVGGIRDVVVDGVNGLLVPPRSPRALGDALLSALRDEGLARRLGDAARLTAAPFTWDRSIAEYERLYSMIEASRRPSAAAPAPP